MKSRTGPRILTIVAVVTMVAAAIGFVLMLVLNAFVFDEYDAYGEVPIPGSSRVALPAGDATVTFHTVLVGGSGSSLPVPPLKYRITGPDGVDAQLTEDYGATTTSSSTGTSAHTSTPRSPSDTAAASAMCRGSLRQSSGSPSST